MALLIDSGFLYATVDKSDHNHRRVIDLLPTIAQEELILPTPVLVEVTYLLQARLGHHAMRRFVGTLENSPLRLETVAKSDMPRIYNLLEQYADTRLDFVDATITTIAERLDIRRILTVDRRDFRIIRPAHCDYFEILP